MENPNLGFMASLGFSKMLPAQVAGALSELGYQGVEWTMAHINPRTHTAAELQGVVDATAAAGLQFTEACVQQDFVVLGENEYNDRVALVEESIVALSDLGVTVFNLFTGPCRWVGTAPVIGLNIREGEAWERVWRAFDRLVKVAEKRRVRLAVENVWGMLCHDYYTTRTLIDRYRSPCLGVNYDPSHDVLAGHRDVGWIVRQWNEHIHHVHLKDAVGVQESGKFLFPLLGEGNVDWTGLFSGLDDIGYNGFLSVEFESFTYYSRILRDDPVAAARLSMAQLQTLLRGE